MWYWFTEKIFFHISQSPSSTLLYQYVTRKELGDYQNGHCRAKMNIRPLFEGLTHRKKLLSHYSVSIYHFPPQIRFTAKNLEIIKMIILGRQMNSRVLFLGLAHRKKLLSHYSSTLCRSSTLPSKYVTQMHVTEVTHN